MYASLLCNSKHVPVNFFLYSQVQQAALPEFSSPVTYSWMLLWCVKVIPKWKELFIINVHKSKSIIAMDEIIQLAESSFLLWKWSVSTILNLASICVMCKIFA